MKKKGTAVRARTLVRIKSPASLKSASGEVWMAMTRIAAVRRSQSMAV